MATVALSAAGNAAFPGIGGVIGGLIGGFIDNSLIFPAIFGQPTIEGQRIDGLSIQSGSEGSPLHFSLGRRTRVAGTVIWISDIEEVVTEQSAGGKGGTGGSANSYSYFVSVAIAVNEGEIDDIVKILADSKVLQIGEPQVVTVSGTNIEIVESPGYNNVFIVYSYDDAQGVFTDFRSGVDFTMSGWSNAENNGTFRVNTRFDNGVNSTGLSALDANVVPESPGANVTISQTIPNSNRADRITVYLGDGTQIRDTLIEGAETTAETPAFRHTAYVVIERLALADFGNRLPNFNFIVERLDPTSLKVGVDTILARALVPSARYDTTGLASHAWAIEGYNIEGPTSGAAMLEPLMIAYDLGMYETAGQMVFYQRGDESEIDGVTADELSVHRIDEGIRPTVEITEIPDYEIPAEVVVNFLDANNDYQQSSQRARRINFDSDVVDGLTLPLAMSPARARAIAERRLWIAAAENRTASFRLPPKYLYVTEGDIVPVTLNGVVYKVRLSRVTIGADYTIECEGVVQANRDFEFTTEADDIDETETDLYIPPAMLPMVWTGPPLRDSDAVVPGYYWLACAADIDSEFRGASLFRSDTEAGTYSLVGSTTTEAVVFQTLAGETLGDVDDPYILDRVNTLTVRAIHGTPTTVSDADFLNGANRARMANGEIIGFQKVTAGSGANEYVLSNFMRGLRNTEAFTGTHGENEIGAVLSGSSTFFEPLNISDMGNTDYFKTVAQGSNLDDTSILDYTFGMESIKPFAPYDLTAYRDPTDATPDVVLSWKRRTRSMFNVLAAAMEAPLLEAVEKYQIDLLDPTGTTVESTYEVTSATATIPTADVVSAGYAATAAIKVRVYQISATIGRGNVLEGTV